jgi:tetrahydromethanopterin S-methyltransferase subunit G
MDEKEYYEIISKQLENIDKKIDRLFKKSDEHQTIITTHDVKIGFLWKLSLTAITCAIIVILKFVFDLISKFGGN